MLQLAVQRSQLLLRLIQFFQQEIVRIQDHGSTFFSRLPLSTALSGNGSELLCTPTSTQPALVRGWLRLDGRLSCLSRSSLALCGPCQPVCIAAGLLPDFDSILARHVQYSMEKMSCQHVFLQIV
jgi:hypothetical protein